VKYANQSIKLRRVNFLQPRVARAKPSKPISRLETKNAVHQTPTNEAVRMLRVARPRHPSPDLGRSVPVFHNRLLVRSASQACNDSGNCDNSATPSLKALQLLTVEERLAALGLVDQDPVTASDISSHITVLLLKIDIAMVLILSNRARIMGGQPIPSHR
jgi:hypothetical protein